MITISKLDHLEDAEDGFEVDNVHPNAQTIALPSYADLNTVDQFNFPNGSLDQSRLQVSNNLKVSEKRIINLLTFTLRLTEFSQSTCQV